MAAVQAWTAQWTRSASYEALRRAAVRPQGGDSRLLRGHARRPASRRFTRGGSDITGALAAAALDADVYENWTDVSGIPDGGSPRSWRTPSPIERITYAELRELSYMGAQVLHEGTVFCRCARRTFP